jgi:anti-sigma factor RsiW
MRDMHHFSAGAGAPVPDPWTARLSDYLDGDLNAADSATLVLHLVGCQTCATTLAELRLVVERAHRLENPAPATDLWPGISARLAESGETSRVVALPRRPAWRERRFSFSMPQALAAGFALMLLSAGAVWFVFNARPVGAPATGSVATIAAPSPGARGSTGAPTPATSVARPAASGASDATLAAYTDPRYDASIAELQRTLAAGRGTLDSSTVRVLERNLALIDAAVEQARRAVAADPANAYLRSHLAATMRSKVDLLRKATSLASGQG